LLDTITNISKTHGLLLNRLLEGVSPDKNAFTTSTETKQTISQKICLYVQEQIIIAFIIKEINCSKNFWKRILSNLIKPQENIYYVPTFNIIINTLSEIGYDVQWQILNSKDFGVPQNRERIFIIGHIRGERKPQIFPLGETTTATQKRHRKNTSTVEIAQTIRSRYGNGSGSHILQLNKPKHSNNRVYDPTGISPTLNTMQGGNRQPFIQQKKIRRLTPKECERLQGFPDNWTEGVSDTQRYKCLGNAVTVNVVKSIIIRLYGSK
jgi:site-specific DNA-cytosine methylase